MQYFKLFFVVFSLILRLAVGAQKKGNVDSFISRQRQLSLREIMRRHKRGLVRCSC